MHGASQDVLEHAAGHLAGTESAWSEARTLVP